MANKIVNEPSHVGNRIDDDGRLSYIADDFIFVSDMGISDNDWANLHQPYRIGQSRIVRILGGEGRYVVNLQDRHFTAGDVAVLPSGAIIQREAFTSDYRLAIVLLSDEARGKSENAFLHLQLAERELALVDAYYRLIADFIRCEDYQQQPVDALVRALHRLLLYYRERQADHEPSESRKAEIFRRFLALVNANAASERTIQFYADRLCLAPRYLCRVVKEASGQTIMYYVQEAVIDLAKIALRYSDQSIADIAFSLHFDDPSTFTRYFRKATGMPPTEYRASNKQTAKESKHKETT